MKNKSLPATITVTPVLQRLFIITVVAAFIAQVLEVLYWIFRQYPFNHNLSAYLVVGISGTFIPLLFFATAYYLAPKKASREAIIFKCALLAVTGVALMAVISQISVHIYHQLVTIGSGYWQSVAYELSGNAVAVILYIAALIYLARTKNL